MKKESFLDYIIRNRYVILCVTIVIILAVTGVISALIDILVVVLLIIGAIYLGKRIQEDNEYISRTFKKRKEEITYIIRDNDDEE